MSLYEASFRVKHECPYREISERYPDLTIREWYLDDCQVIEITAPGAPTDDLLDEIEPAHWRRSNVGRNRLA
jgi:predicted DNA binding protein